MGNSRFSDGFLLGALVGGAAVFLLGTKKGNKILSAISEQGIEGFSTLMENLEQTRGALEEIPEEYEEEEIELEMVKEAKVPVKATSASKKRFFKRKAK